jgi:DNA-directed RNA polymerase subunit RPC12/RpoP
VTLRPNEYQCAKCHGVFEKGWSDEEAMEEAVAEKETMFPGIPIEECDTLCADCHKEFRKWMKKNVHWIGDKGTVQ